MMAHTGTTRQASAVDFIAANFGVVCGRNVGACISAWCMLFQRPMPFSVGATPTMGGVSAATAELEAKPVTHAAADDSALRVWLDKRAGLDRRILDKVMAVLAEEEVFDIADLCLLQGLPRFATILTAVTRAKIEGALVADGLEVTRPTGNGSEEEDAGPDWLAEAVRDLELRTTAANDMGPKQCTPVSGESCATGTTPPTVAATSAVAPSKSAATAQDPSKPAATARSASFRTRRGRRSGSFQRPRDRQRDAAALQTSGAVAVGDAVAPAPPNALPNAPSAPPPLAAAAAVPPPEPGAPLGSAACGEGDAPASMPRRRSQSFRSRRERNDQLNFHTPAVFSSAAIAATARATARESTSGGLAGAGSDASVQDPTLGDPCATQQLRSLLRMPPLDAPGNASAPHSNSSSASAGSGANAGGGANSGDGATGANGAGGAIGAGANAGGANACIRCFRCQQLGHYARDCPNRCALENGKAPVGRRSQSFRTRRARDHATAGHPRGEPPEASGRPPAAQAEPEAALASAASSTTEARAELTGTGGTGAGTDGAADGAGVHDDSRIQMHDRPRHKRRSASFQTVRRRSAH